MKPTGSWVDLANGTLDTDINKQADARHYVQVFRDRGVTNVSFAWIMMSWSFNAPSPTLADSFYPGDAWVDWLGVDGYNWYGCRSGAKWVSFQTVMATFRTFADKHPTKPVIVAETGTYEGATAGAKRQWLRDMMTTLEGWPQVKALSYFEINTSGACNRQLSSSASAMDGWWAIAADSYALPTSSRSAPVVGTLTAGPAVPRSAPGPRMAA